MKPPCVMMKQLSNFVGREETISRIRDRLHDSGCLYLDFVEGIEGIGKTTLLVKLYSDLKESKEFNPIWTCMSVFDPLRKGARARPACASKAADNLDDYRQLLLELAGEFSNSSFDGFQQRVDELFSSSLSELIDKGVKVDLGGAVIKTGDIHVGAFGRLVNGEFKTGDFVVNVPEGEILLAMNHLKGKITQEFVSRMNTIEKNSRCVLLMDNFHLVLDDDVGKWFLSGVASKLDNTVVVFTKTKTTAEIQMQDSAVIYLQNFSLEDVELYLGKRLKNFTDSYKKFVQPLFEYSGGHPQAVVLAVDLCESLLKKGKTADEILKVFSEIPPEHTAKILKIVDQIISSIEDDVIKKALEVGWVVRRFDADLMRYLLQDEEAHSGDALEPYQNIISRLEEYSFTENHDEFHAFHAFIRQAMEARLKKNDPKRHKEIHRKVADYYSEKLIAYERDRRDESSYLQWFRYESYDWQSIVSEWLYHLKNTPEQANARLIFLKVYFDAFWWWGAYEPFPFCERLLSEWGRTQMTTGDEEWFNSLKNFHAGFPTGYQKRGKGNWSQVKTALICLRQIGAFDGDIKELDSNRRHLRALTDVFFAQAYFYDDFNDPKAEDFLLEALRMFGEDKDFWNEGWTFFHLANLYVHRQQNDQALTQSKKAAAIVLKESSGHRDYELLADIHRVIADAYWQKDSLEKSFEHYARAVLSAYIYHGVPSPADLYTRSFHREMIERAIQRLESLWLAGKKDLAIQLCAKLQNFFDPYWKLLSIPQEKRRKDFKILLENDQNQHLAQHLFPQLPADAQLNKRGILYTDQSKVVMAEMGERLEDTD